MLDFCLSRVLRFAAPGLVAGLFAYSLSAAAHITLETPQAPAASYYKAVFRVGHGCAGSAVTEIIVHIPAGIQGAKPMPKAGWQVDIDKSVLAQPYSSHGKVVSEDVSQIRWRGGKLPDAWYDEFVIFAKLPEQPGKLYWKVTQICEQGRIDWSDIAADDKGPDSKTPAALLDVVPAAGDVQHHH